MKKTLKVIRAEIRATLAQIRAMRDKNTFISREEAQGLCEWMAAVTWPEYKKLMKRYSQAHIVKYENVSPAAKKRLERSCGE